MTEPNELDRALLDDEVEVDIRTDQPQEGDDPAPEGHASIPRVGRRGLMAGLALGGVAVAAGGAGAVVASSTAGAGGWRREQLTVDIACLGPTWRDTARDFHDVTTDPADTGSAFITEGWIYEGGTIPDGDGFDPVEAGSIGRWFCNGWIIIGKLRGEPHVNSTVHLVFGTISEERVFPPDTLSITGNEGTGDTAQIALRPVVGGTGKYLGASGQSSQRYLGLNRSLFWNGEMALNFRYEIDIRVWD